MNRGDLRLFVTILTTAMVTAALTVLISRWLADDSLVTQHVQDLEARVALLERRAATEALEKERVSLADPLGPPPQVPADPEPCDEVACLLSNYQAQCCAQYDRGQSNHSNDLDRAAISDGIAKVKPRIRSCGERSSAKGQVKVAVKVGPDGAIRSATLRTTPDARLGKCVLAEISRAKFARTDHGGAFSYPFIF